MKRAILISLLLLSASPRLRGETFTVTGYCHCAKCCGRSGQPAANGRMPVAGVTVAGPRRFPFGTRIRIAGAVRVITDRLARRYDSGPSGTERIDIFFPTHAEAKRFGVQKLNVSVLRTTPSNTK